MTSGLVVSTPMTERDFGVAFGKLAMQIGFREGDLATVKSYFEALSDLPLEAIQQAATAFAREAGRKWMPNAPEWREGAQAWQVAALKDVVRSREQTWQHECQDCEDTGWIIGMTCDGGGEQWPESIEPNTRGKTPWRFKAEARQTEKPRSSVCDRTGPHLPHSFTRVCPCRPMNRTYQRHQFKGD